MLHVEDLVHAALTDLPFEKKLAATEILLKSDAYQALEYQYFLRYISINGSFKDRETWGLCSQLDVKQHIYALASAEVNYLAEALTVLKEL